MGWWAMWLVMFPLILVLFDGVVDGYSTEARTASLVGFLVWDLFIMGVLATMTEEISREAKQGTLESVLLSPVSPTLLFSMRITATTFVRTLETLVLGLILIFVLRLPIIFTPTALALLVITMIAIHGLSLTLGGLTLIFKQLGNVIGLLALATLLLSGGLIPLNSLGTAYNILKWLLPTTWGIDALRRALIHGATWQGLWANGTWVGLSLQAGTLMLVGILIFGWGFRRAQLQGSLASY